MKVNRLDFGRIDAAERTSQGFLKAPAYLTRAGVFTYTNADGSPRREYRPTSEVFKADSLATLISAPVTNQHPSEMVTAANRSKYDMGNVGDNILRDGGKVGATLYVKDARLISAVERGDMRETSCGYSCDTVEQPGVVPDGEPDAGMKYDAMQTAIVYNHCAVVPQGRAGSEIRLRLDAAHNQVIVPVEGVNPTREKIMKFERIDGVDYEIDTPAHKAAITRRDEAIKAASDEKAAQKARLDASEAKVVELTTKIAELPTKIAEAARVRADLETGARKVLGAEEKLDGKTDDEIRKAVAAKAHPTLKLDGAEPAYVKALFDIAVARGDEGAGLANLRRAAEPRLDAAGKSVRTDAVSEYARAIEETENAGRSMWLPTDAA